MRQRRRLAESNKSESGLAGIAIKIYANYDFSLPFTGGRLLGGRVYEVGLLIGISEDSEGSLEASGYFSLGKTESGLGSDAGIGGGLLFGPISEAAGVTKCQTL